MGQDYKMTGRLALLVVPGSRLTVLVLLLRLVLIAFSTITTTIRLS